MSTTSQFKRTLNSIHGVKPGQTSKLPWLLDQLNSESAALRLAAISAVDQLFYSSRHAHLFLSMVDSEVDQDVVIRLMSVLSARNQGSRDLNLARRFIQATDRLKPCGSGTRDALADALLRVMDNLESAAIWKLSTDERSCRIARIQAELGVHGTDDAE